MRQACTAQGHKKIEIKLDTVKGWKGRIVCSDYRQVGRASFECPTFGKLFKLLSSDFLISNMDIIIIIIDPSSHCENILCIKLRHFLHSPWPIDNFQQTVQKETDLQHRIQEQKLAGTGTVDLKKDFKCNKGHQKYGQRLKTTMPIGPNVRMIEGLKGPIS